MPVVAGLLIFAAFLIAILVIGGWFVLGIFRFFTRLLFGPNHNRVIPRHVLEGRGGQCARPNCRTVNAPHARFCRRCGESLAAQQGGFPRRVA